MSAHQSLNEYLDQHAPADDGERREHFTVDDAKQAEWAMRKLAGIRRNQSENTEVADYERGVIDAWLKERNDILERDAEFFFFEALLTDWHRPQLDNEPTRKTISLPSGELQARKQPDRWTFTDDFTAWAEAKKPDLVRTRVEIDKTAAKKRLDAITPGCVLDVDSGEKVPGVTVEQGDVKFTARPIL